MPTPINSTSQSCIANNVQPLNQQRFNPNIPEHPLDGPIPTDTTPYGLFAFSSVDNTRNHTSVGSKQIDLKSTESRAKSFGDVRSLSHDIRNMMATIRLAAEELELADNERTALVAKRISKVVDACTEFCRAATEFQPEDARLVVCKPICVVDLAEEVVSQLSIESDSKVNFHIHSQPDLVAPLCRARLHRVLFNLLKNSLDAITAHSGSRIDVDVHRLGTTLIVDICDDGPGMDFTRSIKPQTDAQSSGNRQHGIGLPTAIALTREMGGRLINRRSGPDGTSFRLSFPGVVSGQHAVNTNLAV